MCKTRKVKGDLREREAKRPSTHVEYRRASQRNRTRFLNSRVMRYLKVKLIIELGELTDFFGS